MSWFDEQIKYRKEKDNAKLNEAIDAISAAVSGVTSADRLTSEVLSATASEEIAEYYHVKDKSSLISRPVELDEDWYKCAVGAFLCRLKDSDAYVAVLPGKINGYYYKDPVTGKKVKINKKTAQIFETEAFCFYEPLPLRTLRIVDLIIFAVKQMSFSDVFLYILMMIVATALGLISPQITKWLFGGVLESKNAAVLVALAVFMVAYSISQLLFGVVQSLVTSRIDIKQNIAVSAAVMNRVLSLPAPFFRDYSSGELTNRAMYVQSLCNTLINSIGKTAFTSLFSLVYIGQVFKFAPALVGPSLTVTFLTVLCSTAVTFFQMKISKKRMLISSKTSGMTYSMITGIQKIKLSGSETRMFSRWAEQYAKEAKITYNPPTFIKLSGTLTMIISAVGTLVMYYLAVKTKVSVSDYYAFTSAYGMVSGAFTSLAGIAFTIAEIKPTLDMARPIMETEPEVSEDKEEIKNVTGNIEINHVSFRYKEEMPLVLDDLSLKIRAGEYIAICGATGCGKSTLIRLLLGFEKPNKGSIFFDGKDITKIDIKSLRQKIGTVMQNGRLFLGDIYSNITISAPRLTLDDAWEAARLACVDEDIKAMPMGMNTLIAEGQGGVSGGQKQRLLIARAIAPKPKVLIFDEATSALDNVTQKKVSEAIDALKCTRIVVAHRLSTIRHCDRIIVLDGGKICEDGTYEELIEKNGIFADLVKRQRLDV